MKKLNGGGERGNSCLIRAFANTVFKPVVKESGCWLFHLEALMVGSHRK